MDDARIYENSRGAKIVQMGVGSLEAYRRLKADGAILVFDTGWDDAMSLETYREYLELADYYTPNQKEALKITGTDQPADAARVLTQFFDKVIVKLDKDGCLILEDGTGTDHPQHPGRPPRFHGRGRRFPCRLPVWAYITITASPRACCSATLPAAPVSLRSAASRRA